MSRGDRKTRPHRSGQRRLTEFNVRKPLRVGALDQLELMKLEGLSPLGEDATLDDVVELLNKIVRQAQDKGFAE